MLVSGPGQKSFTLHLFVGTRQSVEEVPSTHFGFVYIQRHQRAEWVEKEQLTSNRSQNVSSSRWDTSCTRKVLHLPYKITILRAWTSRKFVKGNVFPVYKQKMKTYLATNCNFSNIPDCSTNFKAYLRSDFIGKMGWYKTWIYYAISN